MTEIAGKVAVVTGGSKGIGRAIAAALAGAGVHTALCSRNKAEAQAAASQIAAANRAKVLGLACDVRDYSSVQTFIANAVRELGRLDILINNAGVGVMRPIQEMTPEDWHTVIETNLNGVFYCCREAIPHIKRQGGGFIINISSLAGKNPFARGTAYNASKFAVNGFSEALMQDVRYDGIRVSYIMPGSVETEFAGITAGSRGDWKIHPEDVAEVVLQLLRHPNRSLPSRVEMRPSQPPKKG